MRRTASEPKPPEAKLTSGHFETGSVASGDVTLPYQVWVPAGYSRDKRWPLVLCLHGSGERGSDGERQMLVGVAPFLRMFPERFPALVVFPQAPAGGCWCDDVAEAAFACIDRVASKYSVDDDRVSIVGLSMGGYGAWQITSDHPERFAAIVTACGGIVAPPGAASRTVQVAGETGDAYAAVARRLRGKPAWLFHGADDPVIPVQESRKLAAAFASTGTQARYTEFPHVGHDAWDPAFATHDLWNWLWSQSRPDAPE